VIDKYRVEELVGAGGFAVVYRATHLLLHMPVAIKLLRPERLRQHPDLPRMLCTEARNSARINHPRVVRVHDANHTARLTYVVMEYIDGITLGEAVAVKGRLPVRLMLRLGIQVAEGLSAALAAGLVHRDIKPSNILLDRQGDARIVDLGLAQQQAGPGAALDPTTVPQVVGTPGYIAPEAMRRAGAVDHRRDIFSLGVTLYQSLCGTLPFPAAQGIRPGRAPLVPEGPPTAPQALRPELPAALSELLVRMLRPAPEHRPASYELLIDELRALLRAP
jgi:serine/threonine-protein kinase